jgi:anti-sigma factor RsiW
MTRCLDEATLQSYFDGELSSETMESATLHLASCATCAAAARELEQETSLLMAALAPEFEVNVPTERLRERIDAAVLDVRIGKASSPEKVGFGAFVSGLLSFGSQRTLGYASLAMLLAFVAFYGLTRMGTTTQNPVAQNPPQTGTTPNNTVAEVKNPPVAPPAGPTITEPAAVNHPVVPQSKNSNPGFHQVKYAVASANGATPKSAPTPVKLLPGERSYLQTIARLDTAIKSNPKAMRPSLQVEYQRNLAVVDRAIAATRSAAKSNPNDPDAADFMFAAYQSKGDLRNTIADARLGGGRSH